MAERYRVLVTGSRTWRDETAVREAIASVVAARGPQHVTIVHGHCPTGADAMADRIAIAWGGGLIIERHAADWDAPCVPACRPGHRRTRSDGSTWCPAAGIYRDTAMTQTGIGEVLAFIDPCAKPRCRTSGPHGSHGASYTADLAQRMGIPVRRWPR
ncbi:SLOG family protein [Spongiactinospora sp. TRM90649]|uniref:SLOG family protein n=1 Tax=Spongiactinospora sp. TRM90649 TaxID=3031114 RepID=UPI0023F7E516|nr:SLOG family protein [Spongiactinospora sp. TRM90649]MDF5756615.1 SLOG family protein [Spongiactinospora sp. TRM90649]